MSIVQNVNTSAEIAELTRVQKNQGSFSVRGSSSSFSILTSTGTSGAQAYLNTVTGSKLTREFNNNEVCFNWNADNSAGSQMTMTAAIAGMYRVWVHGDYFFSASTMAHNTEWWLESSKQGDIVVESQGVFQFAPDGNNYLGMNLLVDCDVGTTLKPVWESGDSVNVNFRCIAFDYQAIE